MKAPFIVEVLGDHEGSRFSCGTEALDRYFKAQVTQDIRGRVTTCFVAVEGGSGVPTGGFLRDEGPIPW